MEKIIFGKNDIQRIVSCEIHDSSTTLFIEHPDRIEEKIIPNKYWLLSNQMLDSKFKRLDGDQFYRWRKDYATQEAFLKDKKQFYRSKTYSVYDNKEAAMISEGFTYYKGMKANEPSILSFDIESTSLEHGPNAKVLMIANTFRKNGVVTRKIFCYDDYKYVYEMFDAWCAWVREVNPSIICGHNIIIYDLPYLNYCATRAGTTLNLGRDESALVISDRESKLRKDGSQFYKYHKCKVYGREIVDTFFLALKYDIGRKYENYKLKQIIKQEKLEVKDRQFYDADKIRDNYTIPEEWEKIKRYAEHDGDDALSLFDLMSPSIFYLCQSFPKSFQAMTESASGSQINSFLVRSYLQDGHSVPQESASVKFEGAISIGNPGVYHDVIKVDVASLYPSIILTYNIYDRNKDPKAHFLNTAKYFTEERLRNKKLAKETGDRYYKDLEQAQKVVINSFYGFMGAEGLLFNSPANAEFITRKGREILQKAIDWSQENGFTLVNADTDSISITLNTSLDEEDQNAILNEINALFPSSIRFEHDGYFKDVLVIKAKNYVLRSDDKLKIKGSALKATTKERRLQEFNLEVIQALISDKREKVIDIYNSYVKEVMNLKSIKGWTSKKTITEKVLDPKRTNEQRVLDALGDDTADFQEGDKIYVYFNEEGNLKLEEHWQNDHNRYKLMEKIWKTLQVFDTVLDIKAFPKYHLKTKRSMLDGLA